MSDSEDSSSSDESLLALYKEQRGHQKKVEMSDSEDSSYDEYHLALYEAQRGPQEKVAMSDLEDSFSYEKYRMALYEQQRGPPLIKKKARLIAAVVQNQVEVLQELLDSPEWYNVRDKAGCSLLQIAVLCENVAVFDHLLSLPRFPLDCVNKYNVTALQSAVIGPVNRDRWFGDYDGSSKEHFAYELLKKGANFDRNSLMLHEALHNEYFRAAILLIQKGFNVNYYNARGVCGKRTPLEFQTMSCYKNLEVVMALLMYGAEPSIDLFHEAILFCPMVLVETMFFLLIDEYSTTEVEWYVLAVLAERNLPLFDQIILNPIKTTTYPLEIGIFIVCCLSIGIDSLRTILTKLSPHLSKAVSLPMPSVTHCLGHCITPENLENLEVLLESNLRPTVISFIRSLDTRESFSQLVEKYNEPDVVKTYCYLMSYGLPLRECDLSQVYERYGYCETFKIFLHMDVPLEADHSNRSSHCAWPLFLYSAGMDLEQILRSDENYTDLAIFFKYFRDPHVVNAINGKIGKRDPSRQKTTLEMPLLLELARNAFRKFLVETFKVTTGRRFYTLLNCLDISPVYKKIITYETTLY